MSAATTVSHVSGPPPNNAPQPNDPGLLHNLDSLGTRIMQKVQYRKVGGAESLWVVNTVRTPAALIGPLWAQLDVTGGTIAATPVQQGVHAPDNTLWRWMGSAAIDHSGDLAIGYSASGPNYFPSLHYAGRLPTDPLNDLTQGEAVMFLGQGIEVNTGIFPFRNRWGDYSAITIDPNDDCTFWYTNEYLAPNALTDIFPVDWHTRIGSFKFPQCVSPTNVPVISAVSRKVHGSAGTFDVDLPLTGTGIECRTGGPSGNHRIVVTFAVPVTFTGASTSCGSVMGTGVSGSQVTIDLTGVPNASRCSVTLHNLSGDLVVPVAFLIGDTNGDGFVNSADITQTKSQSGSAVTVLNFREDLNTDGFINSADITSAKSKSGTALP